MKMSAKKAALRRSEAAKKANFTRAARKIFMKNYGVDSYDAAIQYFRGKNAKQAEGLTGINVNSVRAVYANLSRAGKFYRNAWLCNF